MPQTYMLATGPGVSARTTPLDVSYSSTGRPVPGTDGMKGVGQEITGGSLRGRGRAASQRGGHGIEGQSPDGTGYAAVLASVRQRTSSAATSADFMSGNFAVLGCRTVCGAAAVPPKRDFIARGYSVAEPYTITLTPAPPSTSLTTRDSLIRTHDS